MILVQADKVSGVYEVLGFDVDQIDAGDFYRQLDTLGDGTIAAALDTETADKIDREYGIDRLKA